MSLYTRVMRKVALHLKSHLPTVGTSGNVFDLGESRDYDYGALQAAYEANQWVFSGVNAIGDALGAVRLKLMRMTGKGEDATAEEVFDHEVLTMLQNPSPGVSQAEFIRASAGDYSLNGESLWLGLNNTDFTFGDLTTKPTQLVRLKSSRVPPQKIVASDFGTVVSYTYQTQGRDYVIPSVFISHARNYNPASEVRGTPTIQVARHPILMQHYMGEYNADFFRNDATPSGVLTSKGVLSPTDRTANKEAWLKEQGKDGARRRGIAVLDSDVTFESIAQTAKEGDFIGTYKLGVEQILAVLGTPPVMVGLLEHLNLANSREQKRIFYQNTVVPTGEALTDSFNGWLNIWYKGEHLFLSFAWEEVDALQYDRKTSAEIAVMHINTGVLSPDEVRADLDRPEREDGQGGEYRAAAAGLQITGLSADRSPLHTKAVVAPTRGDQWYARALFQERAMSQFERAMTKYFNEQRDRIIDALEESAKSGGSDVASHAKSIRKVSVEDILHLFDSELEAAEIRAAAEPMLQQITAKVGRATIKDLVSGVAFNEADPLLIAAIENKIPKIQGVNDGMRKALRSILSDASADNLSVGQTSKLIRDKWAEIGPGRASVIARTETVGAQNIATERAFDQSGVVKAKEWLTSRDADVRDSHAAIDGEQVPIGSRFSNGVDVPAGDGPAGEVVNCRCVMLAVLEDE